MRYLFFQFSLIDRASYQDNCQLLKAASFKRYCKATCKSYNYHNGYPVTK